MKRKNKGQLVCQQFEKKRLKPQDYTRLAPLEIATGIIKH